MRVKKAIAAAMHTEMIGVVAEIRAMTKALPAEQQKAIAGLMDNMRSRLAKVNHEYAAQSAVDTLPDADIDAELAVEMDELDREDDDAEEDEEE